MRGTRERENNINMIVIVIVIAIVNGVSVLQVLTTPLVVETPFVEMWH